MRDDAFSEEVIVLYLLGDLPEEKQVEIEDRAFRDREYLQNIEAVEKDLIDEYVRGELTGSERIQFEDRFLRSAERRRKVEFARALASVTPEFAVIEKKAHPVIAPAYWQDTFRAFLRGLGPAAKFSMAAAALLVIIGVSWLALESIRLRAELADLRAAQQLRERQEGELQQQIADERARSLDLSARLQREQQQREHSEEPARELERKLDESATQLSQSAIVSLALAPGISRSGGARPKLVVPQTARRVRLQIGIEPEDEYKSFRVELRAQGGREVWTAANLSARRVRAGRAVILNLPASVLSAGVYELALKGVIDDRRLEEVGYYYLDVLKK
jgi:hypothetical protein